MFALYMLMVFGARGAAGRHVLSDFSLFSPCQSLEPLDPIFTTDIEPGIDYDLGYDLEPLTGEDGDASSEGDGCSQGSGRVVNGTDAAVCQFPFAVSLQRRGHHTCGGSIINENWILTAAHCVDGNSRHPLVIHAGTTDLDNGCGVRIPVKEIFCHEKYDQNTITNDIALLKLEQSLTLGECIKPVGLPKQKEATPSGTNATLVGWGLNYTGGSVQHHLQKVDLIVWSDEECRSMITELDFYTDRNLCAGVPGGGKGQCSGDSGGPLVAGGRQLGIVSWSMKPCTKKGPGVYTEVAHFVDWIEKHSSNSTL